MTKRAELVAALRSGRDLTTAEREQIARMLQRQPRRHAFGALVCALLAMELLEKHDAHDDTTAINAAMESPFSRIQGEAPYGIGAVRKWLPRIRAHPENYAQHEFLPGVVAEAATHLKFPLPRNRGNK